MDTHEKLTTEDIIARLQYLQTIPFDINAITCTSLSIYGDLGTGPLIGCWASFTGKTVQTIYGDPVPLEELPGQIVGDNHEMIVIAYSNGYLGWLRKDQYRLVNMSHYDSLYIH